MGNAKAAVRQTDSTHLEGYLKIALGAERGLLIEIDSNGVLLELVVSDPSLLMRPREEQVGATVHDLFDPDKAAWFMALVSRVCQAGVAEKCDFSVDLPDETRWFTANVAPAPWSTPEHRSVVFVNRDITEAKLQEVGRQTAERELDAFIEAAPFAVLIHDGGAILRANAAAAATFGFGTTRQMVGKELVDLAHPGDRETLMQRGNLGGGRHTDGGEVRGVRSDGSELILECMTMPLIYAGSPAVAVLCNDVTEDRRHEEERRFLAVVANATHDAISAADLGGRIIAWSKGAERLYGYTAAEAVGGQLSMLFPPGSADEAALRDRAQRGEHVFEYETTCLHKDGHAVAVAGSLSPIFAADGTVAGVAGVTRDITEQKRMQESLALAHRMASVGTLAAGLAHEINNPLAFVTANLGFAQETLAAPTTPEPEDMDAVMAALGDARLGADRIRAIVRDFKTFSRSDEGEAESAVSLASTLERAAQMARNEIKHRARLSLDVGPVPRVAGGESRLGQVFVNLLINASQAIREDATSGEIRVVARTGPRGEARVRISDNGTGIPPEVLPRIFDPFFTTKAVGVGTGLGLSICHGIVSKLGGSIEVESQVGKGTTFTVVLPAAAGDTARPAPMSLPKRVRRARILVVDDEPMVARAVARMLGRDHEVTATTHAKEALAKLRSGERFDLVFSDLMMPEMSGMELFAAISELSPEQASRVVFLTGGAFTPAAQRFLEEVPNQHLDKPFDRQMLTSVLAAMIPLSARAPASALARLGS